MIPEAICASVMVWVHGEANADRWTGMTNAWLSRNEEAHSFRSGHPCTCVESSPYDGVAVADPFGIRLELGISALFSTRTSILYRRTVQARVVLKESPGFPMQGGGSAPDGRSESTAREIVPSSFESPSPSPCVSHPKVFHTAPDAVARASAPSVRRSSGAAARPLERIHRPAI
jgi:hypothetical protein